MYFIPVIKAEYLALLIAPVSSHISSYCQFWKNYKEQHLLEIEILLKHYKSHYCHVWLI